MFNVKSIFFCLQFDASVQLLKSNTDYKKPISQMEVKEIGAKQFILVVLCDGVVAVHYISQVRDIQT
jgi:hypothetical protein